MDIKELVKRNIKAVEIDGTAFHLRPLSQKVALRLNSIAKKHGLDLTGGPLDEESTLAEKPDAIEALLELSHQMVIDCVCDENGKRVFTDADREQIELLPPDLLKKLMEAAGEHTRAVNERKN